MADGHWTEYKLKAMDGTVEKDADIEAELAQYRSVIDEVISVQIWIYNESGIGRK